MEIPYILRQLGFNDREIRVYLALLSNGVSSIKKIVQETGLNRSLVDTALKSLSDTGLVGTFQRHKKPLFMAESPDKLIEVLERRERGLVDLRRRINEVLPELRSIYSDGTGRPAVKYYEGMKGVDIILKDILATVSEETVNRLYRTITTVRMRQFIYREFSSFTKERIAREIRVRALVMGEGSEARPLFEQRALYTPDLPPDSCEYIYGNKIAFISIDDHDIPSGILVEDQRVAVLHKTIFDRLWNQPLENTSKPQETEILSKKLGTSATP